MNLGKAVRTLSMAALVFTPVVSEGQSDTAECTVAGKETREQTSDAFYSLNGQQYGELDLPISLQQSLYDARLEHYKVQIAIIDQVLLLGELERLAKASGLSVDEMAERLFRENTPTSEAIRLGITGTPAIFLNGRRLHLHDIQSVFSGAVISALSEINNQS